MPRFGPLPQSRDQPLGRSGQPPAIAPKKGSSPATTRSGSGASGESFDRSARRRRSARTPGAARRGAVIAYRAAQHREPRLEGIKDRPLGDRPRHLQLDLAANPARFFRWAGSTTRITAARGLPPMARPAGPDDRRPRVAPSASRRPARVVAAHDVPVLLHEQRLESRRVHRNAVHAAPDLGVPVRYLVRVKPPVDRLPGFAAAVGAERAAHEVSRTAPGQSIEFSRCPLLRVDASANSANLASNAPVHPGTRVWSSTAKPPDRTSRHLRATRAPESDTTAIGPFGQDRQAGDQS
jgi:hypothetical protein